MRVLVISDVHGNHTALETVLEKAGKVNAVWCLGDVVGYGPKPNECIDLLNEQPNLACLLGNHDSACVGDMSIAAFNHEARVAVEWTQGELTEENVRFLKERPLVAVMDEVTLAHGSPRQPVFEYLLDTRAASENFDYFDNEYCFVGHSHLPLMFSLPPDESKVTLTFPQIDKVTQLRPRAILNPGSVGQPRDRDPRASFAIFDTAAHTWHYQRVEYDVEKTQKQMVKSGLPKRHSERLAGGW